MTQYIHELSDWPAFSWNEREISPLLASVRFRQGSLIGQMKTIGFGLEIETSFQVIAEDVIKTSQIEGELSESDRRVRRAVSVGSCPDCRRYLDQAMRCRNGL